MSIGSATSYTTMLGCKNNREDNLKKLARATAFRLAKEYQEKNRVTDSSKKIENKFTIKTSQRALDRGRFSTEDCGRLKKKKYFFPHLDV